ncbi:MAG TPA: pyridoxamine 5'-phosphate oxidase family protein [Polyangiaceae bacterium]|jgi:general stress protein 26|nr:pyridoxamine 5'-phosphate oxidase family protein [Polyangiaceae bacterium]
MTQLNEVPANYASAGAPPKSEEHFFELLGKFETATLVTRARNTGELHGRPMAVAAADDDGTLWFITNVDSTKVLEVREDSRALVTLASSRKFVTLNGHLELVADREQVDRIWKERYRVWFEDQNDPELVLLRFTPFDGEFWDDSGARGVKHAFEAAKAYLRGQKLGPTEGDAEARAKVVL